MLFNSYEFIFAFMPIAFFVYFYLNTKKLTLLAKAWLVLASLFFYSWWNISYLPLIVISILVNYFISNLMILRDQSRKYFFSNKLVLQIGLCFNIGLLAYFKYMDFFISNINTVFGANIAALNLALPLAISFFTLQQIAFLVDSYEGLVKENKFLTYALFVTFFPQLIAGPIVHHKDMMPQFLNSRRKVKNYENILKGLFIFSIGLFKKVILADTLAVWATAGFDGATSLNFFAAWATSLAYTFQLYFDFSGYMDMAIGAALLFNIRLPQNFNSPYKATGMIDYWSRWHITLTTFITTYIYTPILRSFSKGPTFAKAMFVTIVAFLISGIWHGAQWIFIFWGLLHGLGVVINHLWQKKVKIKMHKVLAWLITFNYVNITFIFFRAKEWDDAFKVLSSMFSINNIVLPAQLQNKLFFLNNYGVEFGAWAEVIAGSNYTPIILLLCFCLVLVPKNSIEIIHSKELINKSTTSIYKAIFFGVLFALSALYIYGSNYSEFVYFNF